MTETVFTTRPFEPSDIKGAMKLSDAEGWNQTENDWKRLLENPENICLLAELNNEIIGTTTIANYANQIAWIGMVLVDKAHRGKGLSKSLLNNILKRAEAIPYVKLDATAQGQPIYKKFGFLDECQVVRLTKPRVRNFSFEGKHPAIEPIQSKDAEEIIDLDAHVFGANRAWLIKSLANENPNKAWAIKKDKKITGLVLGRNGNRYHHVGPLEASSTEDAKALLSRALADLANQPVVVDAPVDKKELIAWLHGVGFSEQRSFMRMYKNKNPFPGDVEKQFLICGPEFG
jgi:GNAT superfamily N-acetyltransferase